MLTRLASSDDWLDEESLCESLLVCFDFLELFLCRLCLWRLSLLLFFFFFDLLFLSLPCFRFRSLLLRLDFLSFLCLPRSCAEVRRGLRTQDCCAMGASDGSRDFTNKIKERGQTSHQTTVLYRPRLTLATKKRLN